MFPRIHLEVRIGCHKAILLLFPIKSLDKLSFLDFFIGLFGFAFTFHQLYLTKSVAEEAKRSYNEAARAVSVEHYRYCIDRSRHLIAELRILFNHRNWSICAVKIQDLGANASYIQSLR